MVGTATKLCTALCRIIICLLVVTKTNNCEPVAGFMGSLKVVGIFGMSPGMQCRPLERRDDGGNTVSLMWIKRTSG